MMTSYLRGSGAKVIKGSGAKGSIVWFLVSSIELSCSDSSIIDESLSLLGRIFGASTGGVTISTSTSG